MSRLNLWKPQPKRRAGIVRPPVVPGLPMARYNHGELAVRLNRRSNAPDVEPGIAWARLDNRAEKQKAREDVLRLFTKEAFPKLSILTFPGMKWEFERALMTQRERPKQLHSGGLENTTVVGLEREEAVYRAAVANIPRGVEGSRSARIRVFNTPSFATAAIGTRHLHRFFRCAFEDYALKECGELGQGFRLFNAAWLDFNGHIGPRRLEAMERFWSRQIESVLIVTILQGRTHTDVTAAINAHGSIERLLETRLTGSKCETATYYGAVMLLSSFFEGRSGKSGSLPRHMQTSLSEYPSCPHNAPTTTR